MNVCKEAITIPDGCYATIEGNKVVFRKWAYPIPRALEVAALHWRFDNSPNQPETISAFVSGAEWQLDHLTSDYAWKIYNFIGDYKSGKFGEDLTLQQAIDKYFKEEQQ